MPDFDQIKVYEEFFESSDEPFVILDFQFIVCKTNSSWSNIFNHEKEYFLGKSFLEFVNPEDKANIENVLNNLKSKSNFASCRIGNISFEWKFVSSANLEKIYCYGRELISERKKAEHDLIINKVHFEEAQNVANLGSWVLELSSMSFAASDNARKMFGFSLEQAIDVNDFAEKIHQDDRKRTLENLQGAIKNPEIKYDIEYRIYHNKGEKYIHARGEVLRDETGNPLRMVGVVKDITHKILAEKEIEQKNKNLEQIIQTSNEGYIFVDNENKIQQTNEVFCIMLGYSNSDVLDSESIFYISEAMKQDYALRLELLANGESLIFQTDMITSSAHVINTIHSSVPSLDADGNQIGHFTFITDISHIKEIENRLRSSYDEVNKYKKALDLTTITYTTDLNGTIQNVNDNFLKTYGTEWDEVIGRNVNMIESGYHNNSFWKHLWEIILGGNVWGGDIKNKSKSGEIIWTRTKIIPIKDKSEKNLEFLVIANDITQNKRAEAEIINLNASLEETVEKRTKRLIDLNNEKDNFIGMVSHDLKNPLAGILLYSELIIEKSKDLESQSILRSTKQIVKATERMNHIIESILNISNVESGQIQLKRELFNLNKLLLDTAQNYSEKCKEKNQTIIISEISEDYLLKNDNSLIAQIFDNLISNAVKYSETSKRIWINQVFEDDKIIVEIKDEGLGIKQRDIEKVFQKFSTLSSRPTAGESSTGLGLSIVKQLVKIVGGKVWFESEEEVGTSFFVELDIHQKI